MNLIITEVIKLRNLLTVMNVNKIQVFLKHRQISRFRHYGSFPTAGDEYFRTKIKKIVKIFKQHAILCLKT